VKIAPEEKKKVQALGVLGLMLLGAIYYAFFSGSSSPSYTPPAPAPNRPGGAATANPDSDDAVPRPTSRSERAEEFRPVLRPKRKEDRVDPATIDPRIKLYILARLQEVPPAGSGRNLFQFGPPPAPKAVELKGPEPVIAKVIGPPLIDPNPKPAPKPPDPPPPPFGPKYYGLATTSASGHKRAFFLDGEDIIIRAEGETVKGHFRLVRIGQTSCVVEDTDSKRQQTIQIAEDAQG
jgi:hypothetical protein